MTRRFGHGQALTEYLVLVGALALAGAGAVQLLRSVPRASPLGAMGAALEQHVEAPLAGRDLDEPGAEAAGESAVGELRIAEARLRRRTRTR